ncbi:MAG: ROK family protein [Acidimicrobiia bacterium]|nr:ROK family protein [Acidimicrobiia bacterium]
MSPPSAYIGVDLGGTKILARAVDPQTGAASGRAKTPTPTTGPGDVLDAVVATVSSLDAFDDAVAIGIGVPGFVVGASTVVRCANIAGWETPIDVGQRLRAALDRPVVVGNDVNCGALAEHRLGAGRGVDELLAVFVGTGVGGGLVMHGSVVEGARGMVGEIGHVTVEPGGRQCGCGGRGHLEAYAGRAGIERRARELAGEGRRTQLVDLAGTGTMKSRHLARALDEGDDVAEELLAEAVAALARVIGNAATILDLRRVVLGGGVVDKLGQSFVDRIAESEAFGGLGSDLCELRLAERLDDAGVAGAAILAADRTG